MKTYLLRPGIVLAGLLACVIQIQAAGPINRVPNNTLHFPVQPATQGFTATNAFGTVTFTDPVAITSPPGETNRLFILEQNGIVAVITNLASPNRTVFVDISPRVLGGVPNDEQGLLGMVFHPGYATNGYFFLFYTGNATTSDASNARHDILGRFQVSPGNPNAALTNEVRFLTQYDEADNHNGGCLQFGSDGYLYLSLGDEGGGDDSFNNSQRIDKDFFSGIIRIDVDKRLGSLAPNSHPAATTNYTIPSDNPFVGATNFNGATVNSNSVRTEFWAVGLRNPWRFSFDPVTDILYCADVGQDTNEEISIIVKGGNYGWAYREGTNSGPKSPPPGFTSTNPIVNYKHVAGTNGGSAVTGGVVYRGTRLSQLVGAYVFADYGSGNFWLTRYDGTNATPFQWMFAQSSTAGFGVDPRNGDVLMANQGFDMIQRLIYTTNLTGTPFPATLADTGAFSNLTTLATQPGIVPYDLNVPFWSDNAIKSRWFSVPNTNLIMGFHPDGNWSFPTGAVWIKHFELELTNGVPSSRKRLETRFIVKNSNGVYGITYRWGNSLTNATLVPDEGMDDTFVINEGGGILRTQVWHYPSRQECLNCHTPAGGFALGFNTPQLDRDYDYSGATTNQIAALSLAGYLNTNVTGIHTLRSLVHPTNAAVSLEYRVRSYLAANCSHCHQPGGSAQALWDGRITTITPQAGIINGPLINNSGGTNNRVITPGSLTNSMLLTRISKRGGGQMPPLDSNVLDTNAIALVSAWITNGLAGYQSFADWQIANFGSTNATNAAATADPDGDKANNYLEYLTITDPASALDFWAVSAARTNQAARIVIPQVANRAFQIQYKTNLSAAFPWSPLDVAGNEPLFPITNRTAIVPDVATNAPAKFYRALVIEP